MEENYRPDVVAAIERYKEAGQWESALGYLMAENVRCPDAALERQMVDLRLQAFRDSSWPSPNASWPPVHGKLAVRGNELPELLPEELTADNLRSGIMGNGAVIVRGLMDEATVSSMRHNIDQTILARNEGPEGQKNPDTLRWYRRSPAVIGGPTQFFALGGAKKSASASVWAMDSPHSATQLIQFYQSINLPILLRDYFNEPAVLSVKKWVLRRVAPDNGSQAGWHQDGRFLGAGIKTVNMWIALTDCGGDASAPGMEIVANGKHTIYETGTRGACFDWTVGQQLVDELDKESPVLCPRFKPGDALFFDHYNLHRTAFGTDHTQVRYALESWFFAASGAPTKQMPLYL